MKKLQLFAALTFLISTLAGCGGGGGGGSMPPLQASTTVTGVATKGPFVAGSTVKVYAVSNGAKGNLLAQTTTTGNNGSYSANLGTYTGPVIVEVSGSYNDEATGHTVTVDSSAPIRAAIPLAQGAVTLPVTPLTELAVQKAASLTPAAITAANSMVSDQFKVDVVGTVPVSPTSAAMAGATQAQKDYTLALAAVSQYASQQAGATDTDKLTAALASLSAGISSTGMDNTTSTAFVGALNDFVTSNPNNQTGVSDTSSTSLTSVGTQSKKYTVQLSGNSVAADGIQFDLALPTGVTLNVNGMDNSVLDSSFALVSGAPSDVIKTAKFSAGSVTVGIVSLKGFPAGGVVTFTCNIPSGQAIPAASDLVISNAKIIGASGSAIAGASLTVN